MAPSAVRAALRVRRRVRVSHREIEPLLRQVHEAIGEIELDADLDQYGDGSVTALEAAGGIDLLLSPHFALDIALERPVAVKILKPALAADEDIAKETQRLEADVSAGRITPPAAAERPLPRPPAIS